MKKKSPGLAGKRKKNQRRGNEYSERMKRNPTEEEKTLFRVLCQKEILFKFQPFYFDERHLFLPDFLLFCNGKFRKLGVEIDGKQHERQREYDFRRTWWLWSKKRIKIIRFTNEQVRENLDGVIDSILAYKPILIKEKEAQHYFNKFPSLIPTDENGNYQIY